MGKLGRPWLEINKVCLVRKLISITAIAGFILTSWALPEEEEDRYGRGRTHLDHQHDYNRGIQPHQPQTNALKNFADSDYPHFSQSPKTAQTGPESRTGKYEEEERRYDM